MIPYQILALWGAGFLLLAVFILILLETFND